MNRTRDNVIFTLLAGLLLVVTMMGAYALDIPMGAETLTEIQSETINPANLNVATHNAWAGNVTEINLFGRSQTKHWQGYYGEVTGIIVLDDAQNWTMYDWYNPEPKGEIYATVNSTAPDWATTACFRFTGIDNHTDSPLNVTYWENFYNITADAVDGIDETFNISNHPEFSVGAFTVQANNCSSTFTYMNDSRQDVFSTSSKFSEILLTDSTGQLIFTTILENKDDLNNTDILGFDAVTHDFQMLVAEDGTSKDTATGAKNLNPTTYYFYIDIE
jgi:hypothetical protein